MVPLQEAEHVDIAYSGEGASEDTKATLRQTDPAMPPTGSHGQVKNPALTTIGTSKWHHIR